MYITIMTIIHYCCDTTWSGAVGGVPRYDYQLSLIVPNRIFVKGPEEKNKLLIRNAKEKDAYQIANVLLDFYNMENKDEAAKAFINERKKKFNYIVAIENNEILGLVTWLVHGLPKHGLFELDRICILGKSRTSFTTHSFIEKTVL